MTRFMSAAIPLKLNLFYLHTSHPKICSNSPESDIDVNYFLIAMLQIKSRVEIDKSRVDCLPSSQTSL